MALLPRGQQDYSAIKKKFSDDLPGVAMNAAIGVAFVTNQEVRLAERDELREVAGVTLLDLFHLERIATVLDKPDMAGVRSQFLNIGPAPSAIVTAEVLPKTLNIVGQAEGMLRDLSKATGTELDPEALGLKEIEQMCAAVSPHATAPLVVRLDPSGQHLYATWLDYLRYWRRACAL